MANHCPWFQHDKGARNDLFIREAEKRFGHFGYAGYFKLLEVLQDHGRGDKVRILRRDLAEELSSRPETVIKLLDFMAEPHGSDRQPKLSYRIDGDFIEYEVPKFREKNRRQRYLMNQKAAGAAPPPPGSPGVPTEAEVVAVWAAYATPRGLKVGKGLSAKSKQLLVDGGWTIEKLRALLVAAADQPFLEGENAQEWKMALGWLLQPENAAKVEAREYAPGGAGEGKPNEFGIIESEEATEARRRQAAEEAAEASAAALPEGVEVLF